MASRMRAEDVTTLEELAAGKRYEQLDLFGDEDRKSTRLNSSH